jgi:GT2 family glycosyltransferase
MNRTQEALAVSVIVPSYGRDHVLIDTLDQLLAQRPAAAEILVVDQTPRHDVATQRRLTDWDGKRQIRWIRMNAPSQPGALNLALCKATQPVVLFLDDDIRIDEGFLAAHTSAFDDESVWAVAGQVLQPQEEPISSLPNNGLDCSLKDVDFRFNYSQQSWIENGMSGNLSVRTDRALELGGFDENFVPPVSYRFDTEFCKRLCRAGGKIRFEPAARIYHLRSERGGTRTQGHHMRSASPVHGQGGLLLRPEATQIDANVPLHTQASHPRSGDPIPSKTSLADPDQADRRTEGTLFGSQTGHDEPEIPRPEQFPKSDGWPSSLQIEVG